MKRASVLALAIAAALVAGCSDENNPFKSHKLSSDVKVNRDRNVASRDLPGVVDDSFRRDHPAATIDRVEQMNMSNGATAYRIHYTTSEGKQQTAEYNAKGQRAD